MDVREKLVELLKQTEINKINGHTALAETCFTPNVFENMATNLIAHGVTVQECTTKCWDVCYNNGNIQYRCPHCETVFVYMYKNHTAPDVCKECGARLYLPQPPKGE